MARKRDRESVEVNASSMADIAFLLLIFFLVTTTIASDKGLAILLPPKQDKPQEEVVMNQRNIFKVLVNSQNRLLVEDEPLNDITLLKGMVKEFITNNGRNPNLSDSPDKAVVSLKTDRGTSYETYINVLDELQGAYYELRAEKVGLTAEEYRSLDQKDPRQKELFDRGREGLPMQISIAEPTNIGGTR